MHSTNEYIVSPDRYSPHKSPKGYSPHNSPTKEYSPTKEVGSYSEYNPGKSKSKLDYNPSKKSSKKDYTPSNNEYSPSSKQSSKYKPSTSSSSKKKNYMVDSNYDNMKLKKKKQQPAYNLSSSSEDDIIGYKPQSKLNEESGSTSSNSLNSSYENPLKIKKKEKHSSKKASKKSSKPNSGMSFADMLTSVPVVKKPKKRKLPPSNVKEERPGINQLQKAMSEMSRNLYTNPAKKEKKLDANEMTDMEAAALHSSRKKGRTLLLAKTAKTVNKVYTLYDICLQYLSNNIDKIEELNIPYDIVKPVLEKCTAQQLSRIEDYNEELISSTHELWEKHCKKEFRNKIKSKNEFQEWRELYFELCEERDRKLERLKKKIKKNTVLHEPAGKRTKMAFTGIGDAKAPRNIRKAQERNGTGKKYNSQLGVKIEKSSVSMRDKMSQIRMNVRPGQITASSVNERNRDDFKKRYAEQQRKKKVAPHMQQIRKQISKLR